MKRAVLGVRMHSGWGILVAIAGDPDALEMIDRRRIVVTDPGAPGAKQPYHRAVALGLPRAETYLASCATASEGMALAAIGEVVRALEVRGHRIAGCAVLLASGRALPPLEKILASHPLLHTAEGEFFRNAIRRACDTLKIPVTATRERELDERAKMAFGRTASRMQRAIAGMGKSIGPPWTKDHKSAALAAAMILPRT